MMFMRVISAAHKYAIVVGVFTTARSAAISVVIVEDIMKKKSAVKSVGLPFAGNAVELFKSKLSVQSVKGTSLGIHSDAFVTVAEIQSGNSAGEIATYGAIVDNVLVKVLAVAKGTFGGVKTDPLNSSAAILEMFLEHGLVANAQLHTHPNMGVFWSVTDLKQQEGLMELVGESEFTFLVVDGFHWIARTCVGLACVDRNVTLNGVTLEQGGGIYANSWYDSIETVGNYPDFGWGDEFYGDWRGEYWQSCNVDASEDGGDEGIGPRPSEGVYGERGTEPVRDQQRKRVKGRVSTWFTPYRDRR